MKNTAAEIKSWDELEERIKHLQWFKNTFLAPKLSKAIDTLSSECGFDDASDEAKKTWRALEEQLSVRDTADLLLHLRALGALVEHFVEAYESSQGGTVDRALSLLNPRKKPSTIWVLPIDWRN
jgi:hypothetical protein